MDSRRQQIVDAVEARFRGITIANGYETDIGQRVFVWRDTLQSPPQDNEAEFINILDGQGIDGCQTRVATFATQTHEHRLTFEVQLWTATSFVDQTIRKMIADCHKAIGVDVKWGNLARDTEPLSDGIGVEHQGRKVAGAILKFVVVYTTRRFNPYQA